jgi:mRNA interferase HigB
VVQFSHSGRYGLVRVITKKTLRQFLAQKRYADAQGPLEAWHDEACAASWKTPQDIKNLYVNASFVGGNRVVFNIGGNKYRLIVEVQYAAGIVWVKFVGTHAQYDKIDAVTVSDY